jgi:hypothetical protein
MSARDLRAHQPAAGEVLQLRRAHACGSDRFVVTHVALDVRLSCAGCGARLMLTRQRLAARLVAVVGDTPAAASEDA